MHVYVCVCVRESVLLFARVQIREVAVATCCDRQVLVEKIHTEIHQVTVEVPVPYQGIFKQSAPEISKFPVFLSLPCVLAFCFVLWR